MDAELKSLRRAAGLTVSDASSDNRARWAPGLFTVTVYIGAPPPRGRYRG